MTEPGLAAELAEVSASIAETETFLRRNRRRHPDYGWMCYYLGTCHFVRYSLTGNRADLDAAASDFATALTVILPAAPLYARTSASLAGVLTERFTRTGQVGDLDTAMSVAQASVDALWEGHPARSASLSALGTVYWLRYRSYGDADDLNIAIAEFQAAVDAAEESGDERYALLSDLGMALRLRFERTSDPADLEAAIEVGQSVLAMIPPGEPADGEVLSNLGLALMRRFQSGGALADADAAAKLLREAAAMAPPGHPNRAAIYANLGVILIGKFQRTEDAADLTEAVDASLVAAETCDRAGPQWPTIAAGAGLALFTRYQRTQSAADLDKAISMARASTGVTTPDNPAYATYLMNLSGFLHARFEADGNTADLDEAIGGMRQALHARAAGHVERGDVLTDLGIALRTRFRLTGLPSDREAASAAFVQVAGMAGSPPSVRVRAAVAAAALAEDAALAARLLEAAVLLLPEVVPAHLARGDQQHAISGLTGFAGIVASAILADPGIPQAERPGRALALIEASRTVMLSQALKIRDDLADLRRAHPDLADRFVTVRDQLDQPGRSITALTGSLGHAFTERERQARGMAGVLAEIRLVSGYESFGLPPAAGELHAAAAEGPIVTITYGAQGNGGALLLTSSSISYLPLPGLTDDTVTARVNEFLDILRNAASGEGERVRAARSAMNKILEWLWDNAAGPVLGALGYTTKPPEGMPWPHIWWAPGGLLGLLPIHAAGYHAEKREAGDTTRSVLDTAISSYTVSILALRSARQRARRPAEDGSALVVAMPTTPGQVPLPGVWEEARAVSAVLPVPVILASPRSESAEPPVGSPPTRENVLQRLSDCTIAHFACHAVSDASDPSQSRLVLYDDKTDPLTVASLGQAHHQQLELTYLSACSTAFSAAPSLADEAIHLTSAFQLAGSRHVVGTLWPVIDKTASRLAGAFYSGLRSTDGKIDTDRTAVALHEAVCALRDKQRQDPFRWAPYLHVGA